VKLLHLSIPRWSRPLVEVHTLVKLLHQSIHWWSRLLVVHACVALIPTETYVYLSLFRFLLVCLFVCLFSWGLDLTCSELPCTVWRDIILVSMSLHDSLKVGIACEYPGLFVASPSLWERQQRQRLRNTVDFIWSHVFRNISYLNCCWFWRHGQFSYTANFSRNTNPWVET
jgi:hypothetical protein